MANSNRTAESTLRERAEEQLGEHPGVLASLPCTPPETVGLLHELQVHQVELELQNEELQRARLETEEALGRYTELYEFAPVGYLTVARDGTIRQVNLNGAGLFGQPRSRLVGRRLASLISAPWRPVFQAFLASAFISKDRRVACEIEVHPPTAPGATTLELTGQAQDDGESCRVVAQDVTERKKLQAAQTDRLASIGLLAAGVAHEVNNPLAYVLFSLETLAADLPRLTNGVQQCCDELKRQGGDKAVAAIAGADAKMLAPTMLVDLVDRAKQALEGTQRITEIMRALGSFSRVESPTRTWVSLQGAIESAIRLASNQIKFRAQLVRDFAEVPQVWASEGMLSQVFLNLLVNAVHAIPEGQPEQHRIAVRTWHGPDGVFAEISDTGKGIAPTDLGRIFDPFFTTKEVGKGSGLGLVVCQNILHEFGGDIQVESTLGQGARFIVRLPTGRAPGSPPPPKELISPAAAATQPLRGRVLMIDDEPALRAMMIRVLGGQHEVHTAASGREAQALLKRDPAFDAILCDVMMPEMSGIELHEWLTTYHPDLARQVIFITGGTFTAHTSAYLAKVRNPTLEKPFSCAAVTSRVTEMVRISKTAAAKPPKSVEH